MVSCKTAATLAGALVLSLAGAMSPAWCGETETMATTKIKPAPVPSVSQDQLSAAASDENNFLHTNHN
ncbi:hypothetical protein LCGC14_2904950, partial [marine sediment metagenome]